MLAASYMICLLILMAECYMGFGFSNVSCGVGNVCKYGIDELWSTNSSSLFL